MRALHQRAPTTRSAALAAYAVLVAGFGGAAHALELDLGSVSCQHYQDDVLAATAVDPIDTTMWLLGYSIGKAGDQRMYGDALTSFGFALDAECRNNPNEPLLRAVTATKAKQDSPMDLQQLTCAAWSRKHDDLEHRDAESANTLMMWMYGFSAAKHNVQTLRSSALPEFTTALESYCGAHSSASVFTALTDITPPGTPDKPRLRAPRQTH